jgi:hypothetical protein
MTNFKNAALQEQIENGMGFHPGNAEVAPLYEILRTRFMQIATLVNETCPDGRDKSLAVTHIEDGLMRAIRAIALSQPLGEERR